MKAAFFMLSFLLFIVSVRGQCGNWTSSSGAVYYTSPLTRENGYQGTETGTPYTYYWNFCKNLTSTTCVSPTPVIRVSPTGTCTPIGYLAGYELKEHPNGPNAGFVLNYVNTLDNKCNSNTINRETDIVVTCDPTVEVALVSITEPGICLYTINMRSKYGCPINN